MRRHHAGPGESDLTIYLVTRAESPGECAVGDREALLPGCGGLQLLVYPVGIAALQILECDDRPADIGTRPEHRVRDDR